MNTGVRLWITGIVAAILVVGCGREDKSRSTNATTLTYSPVKMAKAKSDVARHLRGYVAALPERDAGATKAFLAKDSTDNAFAKCKLLAQSGWHCAEEESWILWETVSPDGSFAAVMTTLVFKRDSWATQLYGYFWLAKEEGSWRIMTIRHSSRDVKGDNTPDPADYSAGMLKQESMASLFDAVAQEHDSLINLHLATGTDVNAIGPDGGTVLMAAARAGNERMTRLLIDKGADVNVKGKTSAYHAGECTWTALMCAAAEGREAIVRLLLDKKADVNPRNGDGNTALMLAAEKGHEQIVRQLIQRGADVNAKTDEGETALCAVLFNLSLEMDIDGYKGTEKYARLARLLIEKGADPNARNKGGQTMLQDAIMEGYNDIACMLIEKGADFRVRNEAGRDALMEAAFADDRLEVARLLIAKGADVRAKDKNGQTALDIALGCASDSIAGLLKEYGTRTGPKQEKARPENTGTKAKGKKRVVRERMPE